MNPLIMESAIDDYIGKKDYRGLYQLLGIALFLNFLVTFAVKSRMYIMDVSYTHLNYTDDQLVLITTGSQGESMAALSRIAASIHRKVHIKPNDTIVFSSTPIPGNEKAVTKVINRCV